MMPTPLEAQAERLYCCLMRREQRARTHAERRRIARLLDRAYARWDRRCTRRAVQQELPL